jgi:RimJ/RimL family protein N-acetyltransferase
MKQESKLISLWPFEEKDFPLLSSEIENPRFMLQWAGPKYTFPLTWDQIGIRNQETGDGKKSVYVFRAVNPESDQTIGFIELAIRDFVSRVANVESVLVFRKYRGQGYGKQLMSAIVQFGFQQLQMNELTLCVFDFNLSAIACYRKIGFERYEVGAAARSFDNEKWSLVRMKLSKEQWKQSWIHHSSDDSSMQAANRSEPAPYDCRTSRARA